MTRAPVKSLLGFLCLFPVAGCMGADPMQDVPRLSSMDVPEEAATLDAVPHPEPLAAERGGVLSGLFGKRSKGSEPGAASQGEQIVMSDTTLAAAAEEAARAPETAEPTEVDVAEALAAPAPEVEVSVVPDLIERDKKRGLLAGLVGQAQAQGGEATVEQVVLRAPASDTARNPEEETEAAATAPADAVQETPPTTETLVEPRKMGLFGFLGGGAPKEGAKAPEVQSEIAYGTQLPFGDVRRICGLSKSQLGEEVAKHPEKRPLYRVYDSAPGTMGPRALYVTGFEDGCARQFSGVLAMFADVEMHEQLRYGLPASIQPYSATDQAYEAIKSKVCKVARKKPCGEKADRIARDTAFLSVYERFEGSPRWAEILLHDGDVSAHSVKTN